TAPYTVKTRMPDFANGQVKETERVVKDDEGARLDITLEKLTALTPVFAANGSVTAGNASQMSDGAGAVLMVSEKILKQFNLEPLALAVIRTCKLDPSKVNPLGGAIATGHPLGATGAIKTATLVHALRRERL